MVLDIKLFRRTDIEDLRESQRRRGRDPKIIDDIVELDQKFRDEKSKLDKLRGDLNTASKAIGKAKKARQDATEHVEAAKLLKQEIAAQVDFVNECENTRNMVLNSVGNIVDEKAVVDRDNLAEDLVVRTHEVEREEEEEFVKLSHVDLLYRLDWADYDRGTKVAGERGYFLKGVGMRMNQALSFLGTQFLSNKEYTPMYTPFFVRPNMMACTAQLEDFEEQLYSVKPAEQGLEGKFLIATSEQPISCYHQSEWMDADFPVRYCGFSTNFRKEVGSHGRDTLGIFRVHQFDKVEQFVITHPDKDVAGSSDEELERMIHVAEEFWDRLEVPYRVVNIAPHDLNNAAAIKYDLEAFFPASGEYREMVSCSNCTDYQSRSLQIRYGASKTNNETKYVHMLNSTLVATTRAICCIVENYQTKDGVKIPKYLQPCLLDKDGNPITFVPFVRDENYKPRK
eukprot:TRINITY_DN3040_c0_g1_i2.p1 TRINITY_DN3040_c0_g1~~TRINITY_DN3040_c0_g1_i2.p1  ORF type:complete len:454 (+),score=162.71 TRINITY_DN3040_c0_g1_i2:902-2263(+)